MDKLSKLVLLVEEWAIDKGIDEASPRDQFLKVVEETGEIAAALARSDQDELKDAIGDVVVTLVILSMQNKLTIEECLEQAYKEIKGRTGKTVNGVFVKSSDLEVKKTTDEEVVFNSWEEYRKHFNLP